MRELKMKSRVPQINKQCLKVAALLVSTMPLLTFSATVSADETVSENGADYIQGGVSTYDQDIMLHIRNNRAVAQSVKTGKNMFVISEGTSPYSEYIDENGKSHDNAWNSFYLMRFLFPDTSGKPESANALAVKLKSENGEYYKIIATATNAFSVQSSKAQRVGDVFSHIIGLYDKEKQAELREYIKNKDDKNIRLFMDRHLPVLVYVEVSQEKLDAVNQLLNNFIFAWNGIAEYFEEDEYNDYKLTEKEVTVLKPIETQWNIHSKSAPPDDDSKQYVYKQKNVGAASSWKPLDRAVYSESKGETYKLNNRFWVTGSKPATPATESGISVFPNIPDIGSGENSDESKKTAIPNAPVTAITVETLTTGENSVIDLSYANTKINENGMPWVLNSDLNRKERINVSFTDHEGKTITNSVAINRILVVDNATLANNTTFRIGAYDFPSAGGRVTDRIIIDKAQPQSQAVPQKTNLQLELGYVPEIADGLLAGNWNRGDQIVFFPAKGITTIANNHLLSIFEGAENFELHAKKSLADGIFSTYEITPEIGRYDNYYLSETSKELYKPQADGNYYTYDVVDPKIIKDENGNPWRPSGEDGSLTKEDRAYLKSKGAAIAGFTDTKGTLWYLRGYTYANTGDIAESGRSSSENSTVLKNFVKANSLSIFRRFDDLHVDNLNNMGRGKHVGLDGLPRENMWGEMWHGKFNSSAAYARSTKQSYNGVMLGYDKLLGKEFYNGKVYSGIYASKLDGKSTTRAGKGEQDGYGVGVYGSWIGNRGHFADLGLYAAKIKNDYRFNGNVGDGTQGIVTGDYSTWSYGIGAQYGLRQKLGVGWFWEPSASLFLGHTDESSYQLSNGLGLNEGGYDSAIGKLRLKVGRDLGEKANLYAAVSYANDFAGGQQLHQNYGKLQRMVETVGGHDRWWEWTVGGKVKISSNGLFHLDYARTSGSSVGNEWSINGGLNFSWGGFGSGRNAIQTDVDNSKAIKPIGSFAKANAPTVVVGKTMNMQAEADSIPSVGTMRDIDAQLGMGGIQNMQNDKDADYPQDKLMDEDVTKSISRSLPDAPGSVGDFDLGTLTVEAKRPDWEKRQSPGQVSVIYTEQFGGEQKSLPELLDRVPGLFVQKINGIGHYTVARVRGSTAAQVSVYVDGVQMNLTGDAAVNLSAIPADNVERIEVYRGYVPARFAGAPLGGVINIVTKKPREGRGYITQGLRSYGGYTGTYEYSMPLGSGSLMATYARDIWQGDFDYIYPRYYVKEGQDRKFKRYSNGFQNSNGMLKWQDDHWLIKGVWKKEHEELAKASNRWVITPINSRFFDEYIDLDYKEFMLGRRDTIGNLDLGWHIAYIDSEKYYRNVGAFNRINEAASGQLPEWVGPTTEENYLPGSLWGRYHSKKWNSNINTIFKTGNNHLLEFNVDATRETMNTNGNRWDLSQEQLDRQTGAIYTRRKMLPKYNNREYHLTFQDTITLNDDGDFKLTPILRADKVEIEGLGPVGDKDSRWMYSGGVALQKQLNEQLSFKTTWGTYNRHPNFYEIFGDGGFIGQNYVFTVHRGGGNIDNGLWETGNQFDFSLNWQGKLAGADTDTILTYYQRRSNNQMVLWTPRGGDGLSCYCPTSNLKCYGLELSHNMKWKRLGLNLAATWQRSKEVGEGLGYTYNWAPSGSSFVPEWVVTARLDYMFPGDKLSLFGEYHYADKEVLRGDDSSGGKTAISTKDSYSLFDVGVKYRFDKNWRLSTGVNDVFNKGIDVFMTDAGKRKPYLYPLTGRMYYATLEYSF